MSLVDKLRKARESIVEVDGHQYTIRRPTEAEQAELFGNNKITGIAMVRLFVVDWDLNEIDLIPGGNPTPVPFNAELWSEYVNDKPELWNPISSAIVDSIVQHREKVEGAVKK